MEKTLFGQSPARYGLVSLASACLAYASWPLMVVIGFGMVYIAFLLVLIAVVSGVLGVGAGIYHKQWPGIATGSIGIALAGLGVWFIAHSFANF